MNNFNKHSFVLTTNGYKNIQFITPQDYLYTSNNTIDKVCNTNNFKISEISKYSYLQNSIDDLNYLISNESLVEVYDQSYKRYAKEVSLLSKNDWLFHPWVIKETSNVRSKVDLLKTQEFFHDSDYIYLFNNKLFDMSKALQISLKALKQTLICEDKDFEHHLPEIIAYIKNEYNIDYDNTENGFKIFKTFVKNTFVFKMNRFLEVDINFTAFVIATLTRCKINKINNGDNSFLYELSFKFDKERDKTLLQNVHKFIKAIGAKYEEKIENNRTVLNVFNRPLHDFITSLLVTDIKCIVNSSPECQQYFVENLFKNRDSVNVGLSVAVQIKELFLYHKQVLGIKQYTDGVILKVLTDDLDNLDSSLIVEEDGYYSKVSSLIPFEKLYAQYTSVSIKDNRIIHLGFTECL